MSNRVELSKGEVLFSEGDTCRAVYVINSGTVRLSKERNGLSVTIATLNKGDFLGEMALLTGRDRSCTATANSDVNLLAYGEAEFKALLKSNNDIALTIIEGLAERLVYTTEKLVSPLEIL
ncbi:cyclic nucleotide-binding domain-containing protein [Colwellia sp. D2M02]|uniref:Cyclic nucleotide-binding domain-containing protein n=1 Tax=Colwellia asteriadis TaxID=517723 RepID=A0ABN1L7G4_9GAMM|nr:cyclic nucleotide-binding domain-containing protein [Colwellia sp. D2M02]MBU2892059.1 cyclic nucleotide-binding domain-containing protein [Colwellia sp. D2M02]